MPRSRLRGHRRVGAIALSALLTLTASLALASPASAQLSFQGFVTHGDAKAGWITDTNTVRDSTGDSGEPTKTGNTSKGASMDTMPI